MIVESTQGDNSLHSNCLAPLPSHTTSQQVLSGATSEKSSGCQGLTSANSSRTGSQGPEELRVELKLQLGPVNWVPCSLLVWRRDYRICAVPCFTAFTSSSKAPPHTNHRLLPCALFVITTLALSRGVYMMQYAPMPSHSIVPLRWSLNVR